MANPNRNAVEHGFSLSALLNNNRTLIIISVVAAFFIWLGISLNASPTVERVVKDVPVVIDESVPSQLGLEAFGADGLTVDVTVSGKRYEVGDNVLTADDITVSAVTTSVNSTGRHTLLLQASTNDSSAEYTIISKSMDYIEVYFDTEQSVEMQVTPQLSYEGDLLASDEYMTTDPVLSAETVTITGPTTEIDHLQAVYAKISPDTGLRESETYEAQLQFVSESGETLRYLTSSVTEITVTVPVYHITSLPTTVTFENVPTAYVNQLPTVTVSPSNVSVGLDAEKYRELDSLVVGTIDFSQLQPGENTFTFSASDLTDGVIADNTETFTVTVNTGNLATKEVTVSSSVIQTNLAENTEASVNASTYTLTLVGPESALEQLSASDITGTVTVSGNTPTGTTNLPVTFRVNHNSCWVYGSYTASVTVS